MVALCILKTRKRNKNMFGGILKSIFGSKNERDLKKLTPMVNEINNLEEEFKKLSDNDLKQKTYIFKERIENGETLDTILPEAFATVREASLRTLNMRHFDVQLIGGMVLHKGKIAEMKTGEGKTLAATLPAYLNALSGKGVHIITVNDYLAKRDTEWMGHIYNFLGLSVGAIIHGLDDDERKKAYGCDIIYGTNNEFGFDYLRDNMKFDFESIVQKNLNFAIVDEVDSILIDEARTPLIISGPAEKSTDLYYKINIIIPGLKKDDDYTIDEKARAASLTDEGIAAAEKLLKIDNLYDPKHIEILHHINQALKAHTLFKKDTDYIVKNGEVIIVDEFTGRLMPGRRYSEGLHQALEAKENVKIENENQTLATITFQNYFRMYDKLSGMTGTADTEAEEFKKIYDLDVIVIPTNQPMIRQDNPDVIYKTQKEKYDGVIKEIKELYQTGQPVLVGTVSVDVSELLSKKLGKYKIPHNVLNAKHHEKEAEIIAMAGQKKAVTISTNMAGRGTDIVLGESVTELGGLHILGTGRHESRRIDNQLRGRSGRQGDHGSSRFYLALEDDLLRIFGGERITSIMSKLGMEEGEPIEHNLLSKAIENAQTKVEAHNFDIRKHLLEYDDVMNQQREVIYKQRRIALGEEDIEEIIKDMIYDISDNIAADYLEDEKAHNEEDNIKRLSDAVASMFNFSLNLKEDEFENRLDQEAISDIIVDAAIKKYDERVNLIGKENFQRVERFVMLEKIDTLWKDHLLSMDYLKEGIGLQGYAQKDPLIVYKKEGFELFNNMINRIKQETIKLLFRLEIKKDDMNKLERSNQQDITLSRGDSTDTPKKPIKNDKVKIGRNASCPCGSGKKYKKCCGR
jgi:preprotein translocase subunit SecA